jgi:hypothetical protein
MYTCKTCKKKIDKAHKQQAINQDPVLYRCTRMLYSARERAAKHNREFNLTLQCLLVLAKEPLCPISQRPFVWRSFICEANKKTKAHPDSPSLDRIDSSRGYTPDNIWIISYRMNTIKNDATPEELKLVSDAVFSKIMENYLDSL